MFPRIKILKNNILYLWGAVLTLVVAILLGGATLKGNWQAEEETRLEQQSRQVNHSLVEYTFQLVSQVNALLNGVRQFYLHTGSPGEVEAFIDALGFDKSIIQDIYLIDEKGNVVVSHNRETQGRNVQDRDYFQLHRASAAADSHVSPVEPGRITGRYHFRISMRISKPDGSFAGIVLATIEPLAFSRHYEQLSTGPERVAALVGTLDRKVRARFPEPMPDQWQTPLESPLWAQFAKAPSGVYRSKSAVDSIERTYVYEQAGNLPLVMVHGFSRQEIEKNVTTRVRQLSVWVALVVFFILTLAMYITSVLKSRAELRAAYNKLADLNKRVRNQALFDALTGLPNRPMFFDRLSKELSRARRNDELVALLFIDLDGFKQVNDQFGHEAGDVALKTVATRWRAIVRGSDSIARLGGDEFAVVVGKLDDPASAVLVAEKLIDALHREIQLPGEQCCQLGCSIGISIYPKTATEIDSLLAAADAAMYQSKSRGKNSLTVSSATPTKSHLDWLEFNNAHLVGFAEIDDQHRQLVHQVNEINQAIINKAPAVETESLLKALLAFTAFHFDTENRLMVRYEYPGLAAHAQDHQTLLEDAALLAEEFSKGNELLVLQTIKDWLLGHIEGADKPLGAFLAKATEPEAHSNPSR